MSEVELRPAVPSDIPAIIAVTAAAYAAYLGRVEPPSGVLSETSEAVAGWLDRGGIIVAETGRVIVGAVRYEPFPDYVYLGRLAVEPAWQGRGIGRRLIAAVEEWTILLGLDEVRLGVRIELQENQNLYRHLGYVEDGVAPFRSDPRYSYLRMKKRLRA